MAHVKPGRLCRVHAFMLLLGELALLLPLCGWVVECFKACQLLHCMLMAHPLQASSLQGLHGVSCGALAVNGLENGSGWQQSKRNWALPAVMGH